MVIVTELPVTGWAGFALIASDALSERIVNAWAALAVADEVVVGASQLQKRYVPVNENVCAMAIVPVPTGIAGSYVIFVPLSAAGVGAQTALEADFL